MGLEWASWVGIVGSGGDRSEPRWCPVRATECCMIEALKSDDLVAKVGGRFKLCALIQRRLNQLLDGDRPLVERDGRSDLEVVVEEIMQDRITLELVDSSDDGAVLAADEPLL